MKNRNAKSQEATTVSKEGKVYTVAYTANLSIWGEGTSIKLAAAAAERALIAEQSAGWRQAQYDNNPLSFEGDAMWVDKDDDSSKY